MPGFDAEVSQAVREPILECFIRGQGGPGAVPGMRCGGGRAAEGTAGPCVRGYSRRYSR